MAGAGAIVLKIIDYYFVITGLVGMNMFIREEALQTYGMGAYVGIREGKWKEVKEHLKKMEKARRESLGYVDGWGYICFYTRGAFDLFMASTKHTMEMYEVLVDEELAKEKIRPSATLRISSSPSDARVIINGLDTGLLTPATLKNLTPEQPAKIELIRYDPRKHVDATVERTFTLYDWQVKEVRLILTTPDDKLPPMSTLNVHTTPSYANIIIDGTDTEQLTPESFDLTPGRHVIKFEKYDRDDEVWGFKEIEVDLEPNEEKELRLILDYPPKEKVSTLSITSAPSEATVFIDGIDTEELTPATLSLTPGKHKIRLERIDPRTRKLKFAEAEVELEIGKRREIKLLLEWKVPPLVKPPPSEVASLRIESSPSSAMIIINGVETGFLTPETITDLEPGKYKIKVSRVDPRTRELEVAEEEVILKSNEKKEIRLLLGAPLISPPEELATLGIYSVPSGAKIIMNGIDTGLLTAETLESLVPGSHSIRLERVDPKTNLIGIAEATVRLQGGEKREIMLVLTYPPSAKPATLGIYSRPSLAKIFIRGIDTELLTPETFKILPGSYDIKVEFVEPKTEELLTACTKISLGGDEKIEINLALKVTRLLVLSEPEGAEIIIDGIPTEKTSPGTFHISCGTHIIEALYYSDKTYIAETTIIVKEGEDQEVKLTEFREKIGE